MSDSADVKSQVWPRQVREQLIASLLAELERDRNGQDSDGAALAEALLRDAFRERATDLHLDPQPHSVRVRFRIDGLLLDAGLLTQAQANRIINQFKSLADVDPVTLFFPEEARITHDLDEREMDLRLTIAPCLCGVKLAVRLMDAGNVGQRLDDLGLAEGDLQRMRGWVNNLSGLFLVTGPTGSGKTTTLYALLHELKQQDRNIVTIEDPAEYRIEGINQIQVNPRHGLTFAEGLKVTMRLDPDFLMIGEIRDAACAKVAVDAAMSGRVLMSTIHARDAISTVTTLRNRGLADHEIATALTVVVNQRLLRKLCPDCRKVAAVGEVDRHWLAEAGLHCPGTVWQPVGCVNCNGLGYRGRTGVFEVWRVQEDDQALILSHADEHALRRHLAQKGHCTVAAHALEKVAAGLTSVSELRAVHGLVPPAHRAPVPAAA